MNITDGIPFFAFSLLDKMKLDPLEIDFLIEKIIKEPNEKNEIEFIKKAKKISEIYEENFVIEIDHWAYHSKEISEGKYPLELLPSHLRALAKKLFYS